MPDNLIKRKMIIAGILISMVFFASPLFASETIGTIDGTYKYAWGENTGWINFGCDECKVSVTDNGISGYGWSEQYGWINLNPLTSGVKNDGAGTLSGFAWGKNLGWIDFDGVTINSSGDFLGYATIKSDGSKINFNCADGDSCGSADFKVKTDWRPFSARPLPNNRNGGGGHMPLPETPPIIPTLPPALPPVIATPIVSVINNISNNISSAISSASDFFLNFFRPKNNIPSVIVHIPKNAPLSLNTRWNLLPVQAIHEFVFAPLPYEIRTLAGKFPELNQTFKSVGVNRMTDMSKLANTTLNIPGLAEQLNQTIKNVGVEKLGDINNFSGVSLSVPGLSQINGINGKITTNLGAGKIALIKGLPVANFSLVAKKNLPTEFVFARADGELVDLNVAMSIGDTGTVTQQIASLPGKTLRLVVKPISQPRSVTGYFVFKSATPRISQTNPQPKISRSSLTASALFSMNDLVASVPSPVPVENKLVLSTFEYTDPDHDGIYTADVASPSVPGEYEIITIIDYIDPVLGSRRMSMIAVVDPEGYVFEKNNGKETRIPSAIVSLYYLNDTTKKYELWPAKDYQQENPQITDVRGTYSFLVPEGSYYFQVEAPGYNFYEGKVFVVTEGSGIHENIELQSGGGWLANFDWRTALLIVVLLLLMYNLLKDKLSRIFKRT